MANYYEDVDQRVLEEIDLFDVDLFSMDLLSSDIEESVLSPDKLLPLSLDLQPIFPDFMETDQQFPHPLTPPILQTEETPSYTACSSSQDIPVNPKEWMVMDKSSKRQRPPRLFEFLILLLHKEHYGSYASFTNKSEGIFQIHEPDKVAELWKQVKSRQSNQAMTYDKFARAVRWYYQFGILKKTNTRYTFQFALESLKQFTMDHYGNMVSFHADARISAK